MKLKCLTFSCMLAAAPAITSACDKLQPISQPQVVELMNTITSDSANPLEQIFAFDTLMCSDQSAVRDFALRQGAKSANLTITSQVVLRAIFEKENVQVKLLDVEGLSDTHYERIKARPIESFPIKYRDTSAACASFINSKSCDDRSLIAISGDKLSIRARWNRYDVDASFNQSGEKMVGHITFINDQITFPAKLIYFD